MFFYTHIYVPLFFSGITFHRPLIFPSSFLQNAQVVILYFHNPSSNAGDKATHFSFFLSFFLSGYIFRSFWFFSLSVDKQNSHTFLIFFWRHFNHPIWAGLGKTDYSFHHRHFYLLWSLLATWLVWFFLFLDSTFPLPRITWACLANRHSAFKLVACC